MKLTVAGITFGLWLGGILSHDSVLTGLCAIALAILVSGVGSKEGR